ncbi:Double-stranded RNA-binding protein 4 [Ananas comosus]|uniref:Double-stranded RNA-binding protein 4 n=1 Tax=Ananas comosus TaxID=4615 RepID=A0A199W188_ANACO|nr:Double-stranded RNA-binding protein 4 [Ananas comosus]
MENKVIVRVSYKNLLQEYCQKMKMTLLQYRTYQEGPSHIPEFYSFVEIGNSTYMGDVKKSKKDAEQDVAHFAFMCTTEPRYIKLRMIRCGASYVLDRPLYSLRNKWRLAAGLALFFPF